MLVFVWVAGADSFAGLLLARRRSRTRRVHFLLAAIFVTVALDVGALVSASCTGRHPMAPSTARTRLGGAVGGAAFADHRRACVSRWALDDVGRLTLGLCPRARTARHLCESMFSAARLKDMGERSRGTGPLDRLDGAVSPARDVLRGALFHLH